MAVKTVKKIDPMSSAKLCAVMGAIWGLFVGLMFALLQTGPVSMSPGMSFGFIVFLPIGYGIGFFVSTYIACLLYNLVAKKFGGIKIDLK